MNDRKLTVPSWTVPFALLLLCLLSFGTLIPYLGFYWDDWPVILIARLQGSDGFWEFYQYDRPFSAWTYLLFAPLLGTQPAAWQIFALLLRWLAVLGMWWSLRLVWPQRLRPVTAMAFLFAVYPIFDQQPISVAYSQHWISYALYFFSLGAMLSSLRSKRRRRLWTVASLLAAALHLLTMEYFLGLEFLRPILIGLLLAENLKNPRQRKPASRLSLTPANAVRHQPPGAVNQLATDIRAIRFKSVDSIRSSASNPLTILSIMKIWLPYLVLAGAFIIWRLFFLELAGEDPNRPEMLFNLLSQAPATLVNLLQNVLQDVVFFLAGAWSRTLRAAQINLREPSFWLSIIASGLSAFGVFAYLRNLKAGARANPGDHRTWIKQTILVGIIAILLGTLPAWLAGRQAVLGLYGSRFGLPAMFGASLLLVGLTEWFTAHRLQKLILLGALTGLAVGYHVRTANDFRWNWIDQNRFYWQLRWRAPGLQPNTSILSDGELFPYVGTYSSSAALNLLYSQPAADSTFAYWFFDLDRDFGPDELTRLDQDIAIDRTFRSFSYSASSLNSLVIDYQPEEGRCLRLLYPGSTTGLEISDRVRAALPASNLSRIEPEPSPVNDPPGSIFGEEPAHTWCYFYQKAELARQFGDWHAVANFGDRVRALGFSPNDPHEWWPFIQAYAHTGRWVKAQQLTLQVYARDESLQPSLCSLWDKLEARSGSGQGEPGFDRIEDHLRCTS